MKKLLLLGVALLLISSPASAQYIGLFTSEDHSCWCVDAAIYTPFEMYIMCLPGPLGQICAEFRIQYPANLIQSVVTNNDAIISVALGSLPVGMSVCYTTCQYAWHWNFHQTLLLTSTEKTFVSIKVHPDAGVFQFTDCDPEGYKLEHCTKYTHLYLNFDPDTDEVCQTTGTTPASWGAIKSIFE